MEYCCSEPLDDSEILRNARRKHLDSVARKVRRAVELCADHCEFELGEEGMELLKRAKTGNIRAIRQMLDTVDRWQPAVWSQNDAEAVEIGLVAVEYLEYGLYAPRAPAVRDAA
jgi:hypothetical protein